jgi:hypothetical protein
VGVSGRGPVNLVPLAVIIRLATAAVLLLAISLALADPTTPAGLNCDLQHPPIGSGEEMNHGFTLKVFPRVKDMPKEYTGCQVMWAPTANGMERFSITYIERGDAVRIWSPDSPTDPSYSCTYRNGAVVSGDGPKCVSPLVLLKRSLPPGCVERSMQAGRLLEDCKYE